MTTMGLAQVALPVSDADRAETFYGEVLGLPKLFRFGTLVFFDCGGVRLMLEGSAKAVQPCEGVCHYLRVAAIDAEFDRLRGRGVEFIDTPHVVAKLPDHELWMVFFRDPDGHLLALMEERRG
ncbi:MAG TPA: VOC family protein [Lysobacter sp.]|nr:VOC family protein [Lysobacter sp.]